MSAVETRVSAGRSPGLDAARWRVLGAFFLAGALPEFLWSNFPPIMTLVADKYRVGAMAANLPVIGFSVGTILSAGLAGRLIDRRGYAAATHFGLAMLAACAILRAVDGPFWLLVLAQSAVGAAFSFVVASTSSLVIDWFESGQQAVVTGICMIGLYAGLGSSMIITPLLVGGWGFGGMLKITAAGAVAVWLLGALLIRERRDAGGARGALRDAGAAAGAGRARRAAGSGWELLGERALLALFVISFLQQGAFGAVATALEIAWAERGFSAEQAGLANGLFIFGGVLGSYLLPLLQGRLNNGKTVLIVCYLAPIVLIYPLFLAPSPAAGNAVAMLVGLFWLGSIPVSLTLMEQAAGPARAGAASGMFWAFGSAGTVGVVWLFGAITDGWSWRVAVAATLGILVLNELATLSLPRIRENH